jgi:hypothetical protein
MSATGSGIVLVGYADTTAGVVFCRDCGDNGDGVWMEAIYSPDLNDEYPPCFSCGGTLTDTGNGYGVRGCVAQGCDSILTYPDEGSTCYDHS